MRSECSATGLSGEADGLWETKHLGIGMCFRFRDFWDFGFLWNCAFSSDSEAKGGSDIDKVEFSEGGQI